MTTAALEAPTVPVPPAARSTEGAGWFAVTATVLAGIAPAVLIGSTRLGVEASPTWPVACVLTILVGLRFAWVVATQPQRFFEIVFWLFTYVFLGLAPMVQMRTGIYPETIQVLDATLNLTALGAVGAGSLAFCAGLAIAGNGARLRQRVHLQATTSPHRLLALCAGSLLFSSYYCAQLGLDILFASRNERSGFEAGIWSSSTTHAIVKSAATLPLIICFAGLMRWRRERKRAGLSGPTWLPWVVFMMLALVVNPVSVPRYYAGTAVLAALAALGATATVRRARIFALLLAFGLVLGFPYAAATRTPETLSLADRGGPAQVLTSADFDAFDQLNNSIAYVQEKGELNGQQISGAVLFAVPRVLWERKPIDTGPLLAEYRDYNATNLSSPIHAELFIDGSWGLLILGMLAFGYVVRTLDLRAALDQATGLSALAVSLPFYLILILRGSLLQAMAGLAVLVTTGLFIGGRGNRAARGA